MKHSRRPHSKSRNGCLACKTRKIKCDEQKPTCSGCLRRNVECISPRDAKKDRPQVGNSPLSQSSSLAIGNHNPGGFDFTLTDFQLFHHYIMHTSKSFTEEDIRTGELWTDVVPSLACSHMFLMRGLLAIAAFHTAFMNPREQKKYDLIATQHQDIAIRAYQEALANMNNENCHAIFAFSALIITSYFASNNSGDSALLLFSGAERSHQGVAEWIRLIRGVATLLSTIISVVSQGPMAPLLVLPVDPGPILRNPEDPNIMVIHEILRLPAVTLNHSVEEVEAYRGTIQKLRESFALSHSNQQGLTVKRIAYAFLSTVPDQFIQMFGECRPPALVIMAHYCVLLNMMRDAWFMTDKAAQMLRVIQSRLSPEWHKFIEWPVREMEIQCASEFNESSSEGHMTLTPS